MSKTLKVIAVLIHVLLVVAFFGAYYIEFTAPIIGFLFLLMFFFKKQSPKLFGTIIFILCFF